MQKNEDKYPRNQTVKRVLAIEKRVTQPSFWQQRYQGERTEPLMNVGPSHVFLTQKDIDDVENRPDVNTVHGSGVRGRWFNKKTHNAIKIQGIQQIIILGSRLDLLAVRKNQVYQESKKNAHIYKNVKFWEIEKAEVLKEKEEKLKIHSIDKNAYYIHADFIHEIENVMQQFSSSDVDFQADTLLVVKGVWMYCEDHEFDKILQQFKGKFKKVNILFDYLDETLIPQVKEKLGKNHKTGINDIKNFAKARGFEVLESYTMAALCKEYKVDLNPPKELESGAMCYLRKL